MKPKKRYRARWTDPITGVERRKDFDTKQFRDDFQTLKRIQRAKIEAGHLDVEDLKRKEREASVEVLLMEYGDELESRKRGDVYISQLLRRIEIVTDDCRITRITDFNPAMVARFLRQQRTEKRWGAKNRNAYLKAVKQFCRWLVGQGLLDRNPLDGIDQLEEGETEQRRPERALTVHEAERLLDAAKSDELRLYLSFRLWTGLRGTETGRLVWGDLDADRKLIKLRATVTKNKKSNRQPLTDDLCSDLLTARMLRGNPDDDSLIFPTKPTNAGWRRVLRDAGIDHQVDGRQVDLMCLRKTFGTWARTARVDKMTVVDLMRHSHDSGADLTFGTYADGEDDVDRDKAEAIDKMSRWYAGQKAEKISRVG